MSRRYTDEFKRSSVGLVRETGQSIKQSADHLGVNKSALRDWIAKYSESTPLEASEVKRLKKALKRAEQERDILKKALAYFAQDEK